MHLSASSSQDGSLTSLCGDILDTSGAEETPGSTQDTLGDYMLHITLEPLSSADFVSL